MKRTRTEKDSMGEIEVPFEALYGAQTQRAVNNFPVSGQPLPQRFIISLLHVKRAAAQANHDLKGLSAPMSGAIIKACDQLLDDPELMTHFPIDVFQTGSGTSTNMNANEVIARLASQLGGMTLQPNDHVNQSQSSNDVIPSCIHISASLALHHHLMPALLHLAKCIDGRADELAEVCKTGRTHLMDAMPITFGQVLSGWSTQIKANLVRLESQQSMLQQLALGGTAVGTGVNAPAGFASLTCRHMSDELQMAFIPTDNAYAAMATQDVAVALSGILRTCAVSLMKISNDLRWMNSGPLAGLGEIVLPELQPGSSIMPGKVNPVIPESTAMVAAQVMGNDATIGIAGQSGNFELNVMLPLIASRLLDSIELLGSSARLLADKAISGFTVNEPHIQEALFRNPILATALNPHIGYLKAAEVAKRAYKEGRPIVEVAEQMTDLPRNQLEELLNPMSLTRKPEKKD
ncbi:class II fumarate hydratase [Granulosicoccus antarcticus]|uniref:Fumarate hydratase class II n=1 Tax=Granulosicoccus antarcticus IMCC3135 TaxID=1192854 RepID=A0A2Z2NUW1_9GAMM|nr:class II fumarate hydratase [Granulosicoccus antarcticus]ASJ70894.1 Fumarate hydratase class II [Granulosicoccus antarcticus IMCC3135]